MPTRRRRALNSKLLPSRKLRWCLGYQETKLSTHQSILMEYLLKCKQTQQSLCRPEAATYHDDASREKKSAHQTLNTLESTEKGFFSFLFFFCDSKNHLDLDQSTTDQKGQSYKQINMVAPGRTETSLAGW